jgi:hypothetical protein
MDLNSLQINIYFLKIARGVGQPDFNPRVLFIILAGKEDDRG